MDNKIFLERVRSKESSDTSGGLNVQLKGNRKLLPLNDVSNVISLLEQYNEEREKCNKIRLICQVNTICTNVLFNRISEIVKYEGSDHVTYLNYGSGDNSAFENEQVIYKPKTLTFWSGGDMNYQSIDTYLSSVSPDAKLTSLNRTQVYPNGRVSQSQLHPTNAIRDTQLSKNDTEGEHFVYHCGLDIFNNHLIRSKTFKTICKMPATTEWETIDRDRVVPKSPDELLGYTAFNTIADLMRDAKGDKVDEKLYFPTSSGVDGGVKFVGMHLYLYDDILTFNESVKNRLRDRYNGWLGFLNKSKIKSYINFKEADPQDMRMERPIMYLNGGDYMQMYPGRDLYSFVPIYNKYRNRMEKNWNYCITYPSDSIIDGFEDIIESSNDSMKTMYFDENTRADNGSMQLVIYSKAKHGLKKGDRVNIYKNYEESGETINEKIIDNVEVDEIVDEFIFTTFTQGSQISKNWVELSPYDLISGFTANGVDYHISNDDNDYFYTDDDFTRYFIINNKYVNIDKTAQNITYKKTVNEIECDYYVRVFSRLPNFRFASGDTGSEYAIYNKPNGEESLVEHYQKPGNEFENQVSRMAFAKNIYSDDIGELVFMDDIDLSYVRDNLGRPLTDVYLTIVKNNAGYKEWYGYDGTSVNINSSDVEFSHCFGKITCGFDMSEESVNDDDAKNIHIINNVKGINFGYNVNGINPQRPTDTNITAEEIDFKTDIHFYGDLCCYDGYNAIEQSIQPILHRFNTAQRESSRASMGDYYSSFVYDEITKDDYDTGDEFIIKQTIVGDCNSKAEGYYYIPHYRIPVKSFGKLNSVLPHFLSIQAIANKGDSIQITTQQYHYLSPGDKSMIYDMSTDKYYYLTTIRGAGDTSRIFTCTVTTENGHPTKVVDGDNIGNYKLFKIDNLGIPSYAHLLKDGTCRYIWRNVINNGMSGGDRALEEYPFTNGAFYINRRIDLYLRRQDPYDIYNLFDEDDIGIIGVAPQIEDINNYRSEDEIEC